MVATNDRVATNGASATGTWAVKKGLDDEQAPPVTDALERGGQRRLGARHAAIVGHRP